MICLLVPCRLQFCVYEKDFSNWGAALHTCKEQAPFLQLPVKIGIGPAVNTRPKAAEYAHSFRNGILNEIFFHLYMLDSCLYK